jgi:hypothetical protein
MAKHPLPAAPCGRPWLQCVENRPKDFEAACIRERYKVMSTNKIRPTLTDEENPEWTASDFNNARPANQVLREILPEQAAEKLLTRACK